MYLLFLLLQSREDHNTIGRGTQRRFSFVDLVIDDPKNPTLMCIRLKSSKPDPFCNRVDVFLGRTKESAIPNRSHVGILDRQRRLARVLYSPSQTGPY